MYLKRSNPNCDGNRRDKVALRITCIKNVKFKIIKIRTGCKYVGYFYYSENLNWAAQNLRLGRGLDIAPLNCQLGTAFHVLYITISTNEGLFKSSVQAKCMHLRQKKAKLKDVDFQLTLHFAPEAQTEIAENSYCRYTADV